jgi:hypothetical protein
MIKLIQSSVRGCEREVCFLYKGDSSPIKQAKPEKMTGDGVWR